MLYIVVLCPLTNLSENTSLGYWIFLLFQDSDILMAFWKSQNVFFKNDNIYCKCDLNR